MTRVLRGPAFAPALVALTLLVPAAEARTRHYWVTAEQRPWNAVPNGRDAIAGRSYEASETTFPAIVYRRHTRGWERPIGRGRIGRPLLHARVGDRIRVHFLNRDTRRHSMHFHGVSYRPGSDGSRVPGFSRGGDDVRPGESFTYRLRADRGSAGAWPFHDHSSSMHESLASGLYGALSIAGRRERRADREFVVAFSSHHGFQTINGRAFVGNTPIFRARVGEIVQWNVLAIGDAHHTFHVHGHKWREAGAGRDTRTLGPAESFRVRWREDAPGTWLYHCHVESHMDQGMIGIYRVRR